MDYDVFISYSRKDTATANRICAALDRAGISYFIDRQGIAGGAEFPEVLANAIINSRLFLYLASGNSYQSKFTNNEVTFAFNKKQKGEVIPYIIDGSTLPVALEFVFSSINWRNIQEHPIDTVLVDDLCSILGKEREAAPAIQQQSPQQQKTIARNIVGVDLGLSVKWATCNIGAALPSDYGDYFAWGETVPKEVYSTENSKTYGESEYRDRDVIGNPLHDAARAIWGNLWRMPTDKEWKELIDNCEWTWANKDGHNGYLVTSKINGNSIFLPAAGYREGPSLYAQESVGGYWSAARGYKSCETACHLWFNAYKPLLEACRRFKGGSIRPVSK